MQITMNPTNALQCRDYANYALMFRTNPLGRKEIRDALHKLDPGKYPTAALDADFETFAAFEDFAFGLAGRGIADKRLGGALPAISVADFDDKLLALKPPTVDFEFDVGHGPAGQKGTVHVRADGAVLHNEDDVPAAKDREATHHYMHHYFDNILYVARQYLDKINDRLAKFSESPGKSQFRTDYETAVRDFENFKASLQPSIIDGKGPFNWVTVEPVVTNEGYIVSVRVEVNWKNPYHSSSTVRVP